MSPAQATARAPDNEARFSQQAMEVMRRRYLLKGETPDEMHHRVARALAAVDAEHNTPEQVSILEDLFYGVLSELKFTPAGRTLANAGTSNPLVSNCIVLHIEDTMESIFQTLHDAALLQKAGSGLGFPLHLMRPADSETRTAGGTASGPISFLHVYNSAFGVIKQQGRHGANMAVMRVDHPDILEFVHCKDVEGDLRNFNVSVGLTDEFMRQVEAKSAEPWMCEFDGQKMKPRRLTRDKNFNVTKIEEVTMTAYDLFMEIVSSAWKTGEPGCVMLDTVNKANPLPGLGRIESCNPCGITFSLSPPSFFSFHHPPLFPFTALFLCTT